MAAVHVAGHVEALEHPAGREPQLHAPPHALPSRRSVRLLPSKSLFATYNL